MFNGSRSLPLGKVESFSRHFSIMSIGRNNYKSMMNIPRLIIDA